MINNAPPKKNIIEEILGNKRQSIDQFSEFVTMTSIERALKINDQIKRGKELGHEAGMEGLARLYMCMSKFILEGKNTYHVSPTMQELFCATNLGIVLGKDLRYPYESFFVSCPQSVKLVVEYENGRESLIDCDLLGFFVHTINTMLIIHIVAKDSSNSKTSTNEVVSNWIQLNTEGDLFETIKEEKIVKYPYNSEQAKLDAETYEAYLFRFCLHNLVCLLKYLRDKNKNVEETQEPGFIPRLQYSKKAKKVAKWVARSSTVIVNPKTNKKIASLSETMVQRKSEREVYKKTRSSPVYHSVAGFYKANDTWVEPYWRGDIKKGIIFSKTYKFLPWLDV